MSRLSTLTAQFNEVKTGIERIERAATAENRDVTDDEQKDIDALYERAAVLRPELEKETERLDSMSAVSAILAKTTPASFHRSTTEPAEMTAGEFLSNAFKVQAGLMSQEEHINRAARYFPDQHDRAQQVLADTTGILPVAIVGPLLDLYNPTRPVFDSFTSRPMPAKGKVFIRPEITSHVAVDVQAAEFDPLASQKMTLTGTNVTKSTIGGFLDLSQQDVDWTDPSALDLVIQDFARVYSRRTEILASNFLVAAATATSPLVITSIKLLITSVVDAIMVVNTATEGEAIVDRIWLDMQSMADLAVITNTTEETTGLTMLAEALAVFGVTPPKFVVGRQLPVGTLIVGSSQLVESYEDTRGLLRVAQPDILGQRIAYYGYNAFHAKSAGLVGLP